MVTVTINLSANADPSSRTHNGHYKTPIGRSDSEDESKLRVASKICTIKSNHYKI